MRHAETVLNVIRDRGARGLPLEDIYRQLYNRELYLRAYGRLYSNQRAMTKGTTAETVDGMSLAKIDRIIDALRYERFRWTPVRRVNIPKPNGNTRALGIPTWSDKMLQEVIRMILEAFFWLGRHSRDHLELNTLYQRYLELNTLYQRYLDTYNTVRPHMGMNMLTPRSLAEKSLAGFRATISRRITVLYGMTVYVIRCKTLLLHR